MPDSKIIRIATLDQDHLAQYALGRLIEHAPDMHLVTQWTRNPTPSQLNYTEVDILIVAVETLMAAGVTFVQSLHSLVTHAPVLVISSYTEPALVVDCLQAGVRGFVWKGVDTDSLLRAIRAVSRGERPIMPPMAERLVTYVLSGDRQDASLHPELTERENEVLGLIASGMSNKEIAAQLHLSVRTVKAHVSNVLRKLDVADRTQAALVAVSMDAEAHSLRRGYGYGTKVQ